MPRKLGRSHPLNAYGGCCSQLMALSLNRQSRRFNTRTLAPIRLDLRGRQLLARFHWRGHRYRGGGSY